MKVNKGKRKFDRTTPRITRETGKNIVLMEITLNNKKEIKKTGQECIFNFSVFWWEYMVQDRFPGGVPYLKAYHGKGHNLPT